MENGLKTRIYALRNEVGTLRYVGKTVRELRARLREHLSDARQGEKGHRCNWIRFMLAKGLTPSITLITEVDGDGNDAEIAYIKFFKDKGLKLVNGTSGGGGRPEGRPNLYKGIKWSLKKKMFYFFKRNPELVALYGIKVKDYT